MMTLFHGSYTSVELPSVSVGRKRLDFGPGFYLASIQKLHHGHKLLQNAGDLMWKQF